MALSICTLTKALLQWEKGYWYCCAFLLFKWCLQAVSILMFTKAMLQSRWEYLTDLGPGARGRWETFPAPAAHFLACPVRFSQPGCVRRKGNGAVVSVSCLNRVFKQCQFLRLYKLCSRGKKVNDGSVCVFVV